VNISPRAVFGLALGGLLAWYAAPVVLTVYWAMGAVPLDRLIRDAEEHAGKTVWTYGLVTEAHRRVTSRKTGLPVDQYVLTGPEGGSLPLVVEPPEADRLSQQDEVYQAAQKGPGGRLIVLARVRPGRNRLLADRVRTSAALEWLLRVPPTHDQVMKDAGR
jgi:hypothetical protein